MQFDFSDEQKALQGDVRRFFARECPIAAVRATIDSDAGHDAALWSKVGEAGYLAAAIPEAHGGVGAGYLELCLVAEEVGRALAPLPNVSSIYQAAELLLMAGSEAQKAAWLPRLASGEAIGTMAVAESVGEATPAGIAAYVSSGKLSGTKRPRVCEKNNGRQARYRCDDLSLWKSLIAPVLVSSGVRGLLGD